MSCRKGNIPFSWEDSPGVSKAIHQDFPIDKGLHALSLSLPPPPPSSSSMFFQKSDSSFGPMNSTHQGIKIPLPPCQNLQPPRRCASGKGVGWWQEDPFLAAYKECTKNIRNGKLGSENKKNVIKYKVRKSRNIFSCKNSCDVKDDNFVILPNLPPIPRARIRGR